MKKFLMITCFFFGGMAAAQAQQTSPVWPGCEDSEDKAACFNEKLSAHVREHYEYPMKNNEYIRAQVKVSFDVNEKGEVVVKSVEGPKPEVNKAAREMLEKIPDMKPGTLNGKPDSRNFTTTYKF
ncbi:energy transducer TonB [Salinimicrobium oceani]|uniref:Energy transducer TonB n=1 Tax=Salinimicrobium oceani TaxID=2722702 RepID=A0ABX1D2T9_9FLAO|nr:energy transducer TonB [Salinimicrobium oceani]NJW53503.1 energy transducer TonB [Salinimicrobium oceani]